MSRYVLGITESESLNIKATSFSTACEAVEELDKWVSGGGVVSVIVRDDRPIDDDSLRRDAESEGTVETS